MAAVLRVGRRRLPGLCLVALGAVVAAAGCSSGDLKEAASGGSAAPPPTPSFRSGFTSAGGIAYRFGLPTQPVFVEGKTDTRDNGTVVRRWSHEVTPDGGSCTIVAVEQPSYTGEFPEAELLIFQTLNSGSGEKIIANESVPPPAGATAAIAQELTFPVRLSNGSSIPARLFQRQFVTPKRTLVNVAVAAPQTALDLCRVADIAGSIQLTGAEAPGGTPSSSPTARPRS